MNKSTGQQSETVTRPIALLTAAAVGLALWILWSTIGIARAGWVAIPVLDDWDRWINFVKAPDSLSWFFQQHVDHRLVLPKLMLEVDRVLFHARGWFVLVCSFCLQAATGFMLWRLSRHAYKQSRTESLLLAAVIASCIFSAQQWMNFIYPFQVQFLMVYCFSVAALLALRQSAEGNWNLPWLIGSVALATAATFSMANGILVWPILLVAAVWLRMPRRWVAVIAAIALMIGIGYFYSWHRSNQPTAAGTQRLIRALMFWLGHLGSPVRPLAVLSGDDAFHVRCAVVTGGVLAVAFLVGLALLWRRRKENNSAWAMLMFYCVFITGSSAAMAYGRSGGDMTEIYASRYLTPSYLFWVAMLLAAWPILRLAPRLALYATICAAMLFGIAVHQSDRLAAVKELSRVERLGGVAVVDDVTDPEAWYWLYHTPRSALDVIDYLKRNNLTVFSEEWTHWPGIPLGRRFFVDRTPGACEGEFERAVQIVQTSPVRPGWRATGWAWDSKARKSPSYIILADDSGLVAGVALTGLTVPPALASLRQQYVSSTWDGYVDGQPRPITAYVLEADDRSLCAIGKMELRNAGTEVPFTQLGPRLADSAPEIAGGWTTNGYFSGPTGPGAPSTDGPVFGSYPDANTGSIRLGPFHLDGKTGIAIPLVTGPDKHNLSLVVRDAVSKTVLAQLTPAPLRPTWWVWQPDLPMGHEITVEFYAEDKGPGWGQWLALGWPHELRRAQ